jgi:DinB superfamily
MTHALLIDRYQKYQKKVHGLLQKVSLLNVDQINANPSKEAWSVAQIIFHLIMVEEMSMRYIKKKTSGPLSVGKPGLKSFFRHLLLQAYLLTPFKFKAPAGVTPESQTGPLTFEELSERWRITQNEWMNFLGNMPSEYLDKAVYKHPRAGRISWAQTIDFFDTHFDRHQKQVENALSDVTFAA